MTFACVVQESSTKNVVGLSMRGMMAKTKLKPCPFCGGVSYMDGGEDDTLFEATCVQCFSSGTPCETVKEATEAWNTRIKNGKFYKCKNCGHTTMYQGDLDCCSNPDFRVMK